MEDTIDLFADWDFNHDEKEKIEFFYNKDMPCPIDGCNETHFASKTKFQRHWDTKHVKYIVTYSCPVRLCKQVCRRRSDMKAHLRNVHKETGVTLEGLLCKAKKEVRENRLLLDPGFFVYRGRSKVPLPPSTTTSAAGNHTTSSVILPIVNTSTTASTTSPVTSIQITIPDLPPSSSFTPLALPTTVPDSTSRITCEEYRARNVFQVAPGSVDAHFGHPPPAAPITVTDPDTSPFGISNAYSGHELLSYLDAAQTQEATTQTSCLERPLPTLPPIPEVKEEIEAHIRYLCNFIDAARMQCEAAKQKLEDQKLEPKLHQEREARRKLEAEIRQLKKEVAEYKWRDSLFRSKEP